MRNRIVIQNVHLAHCIYRYPYLSMYLSTVLETIASSVVTSENSWNFLAKFIVPIDSLCVVTCVSLTINVSKGYSIAASSSSASCLAAMSVSNDVRNCTSISSSNLTFEYIHYSESRIYYLLPMSYNLSFFIWSISLGSSLKVAKSISHEPINTLLLRRSG